VFICTLKSRGGVSKCSGHRIISSEVFYEINLKKVDFHTFKMVYLGFVFVFNIFPVKIFGGKQYVKCQVPHLIERLGFYMGGGNSTVM
jgi:hypothetical protein